MPAAPFLQGVSRNLRYWHTHCVPFTDLALEIFAEEYFNLYQALLAGFAFPETQGEALHLTLALFECVEARGVWHVWFPILEQALATESVSAPVKIKLLNQLGFVYALRGKFTQAQTCHTDAETLAQAHALPWDLANAWFGLAQVAFTQHQYAPAEQYCHLALEGFAQTADMKKISALHNLLGRVALEKGAYPEAEVHFRQAVALRRAGPRPPLVQMLTNLALALQAQKRFSEALSIYQEALALLPPGQSPLIKIGVENSLGTLYFALEAYPEAEQTFQAMDVPYLQSVGAHLWLASRANNLGNVYLKQRQWMLAETYLTRAATYWRQIEDEINLANTLGDLAESFVAQKRVEEPYVFYEEALHLLAKYPQNAWACRLLTNITARRNALQI